MGWADLLGSILSDWQPLEFFLQSITKKMQTKRFFLHSGNLLEFLVLVPKSGVPPCRSSGPELSENVVTFFGNASSDPIFFLKFDLTLTANNSPLKSRTPKKYHIFGNLGTSTFTWWYPGWRIVFEKIE